MAKLSREPHQLGEFTRMEPHRRAAQPELSDGLKNSAGRMLDQQQREAGLESHGPQWMVSPRLVFEPKKTEAKQRIALAKWTDR